MSSLIIDTFSIATYSYIIRWLIVKILANYIICNSNRSYEACQKQFKLVDFSVSNTYCFGTCQTYDVSGIEVSACQTDDVKTKLTLN